MGDRLVRWGGRGGDYSLFHVLLHLCKLVWVLEIDDLGPVPLPSGFAVPREGSTH